MWNYEKRLQYPVKITQTNPEMAQVIISQFGGPDGELAASMRYLSQRYTMPYKEVTGILTDIGTEESARKRWKYVNIFLLNKLRQTDRIRTCTPCRAAVGTGAHSHSATVRLRSLFCGTALRTFQDIL